SNPGYGLGGSAIGTFFKDHRESAFSHNTSFYLVAGAGFEPA
ncbi:hypothetical protein LCGC14_2510330, partial [marine sediment metagenome]